MSQITGHISQIIGAVIDVYFDTEGQDAEKVLPKIHDALKIDRGDGRVYRWSASWNGGDPAGHTNPDAFR